MHVVGQFKHRIPFASIPAVLFCALCTPAYAGPTAPTITTEPASRTVTAGQTATFSVAAIGTTPMAYQWRKNGTAISGATSSSYTTPATKASDSGAHFTVVVSNSVGSAASSAATLTVNPARLLLNASSTSLSFASVHLSSTSTKSVTLTNVGNSNVTISNVIVSGPGFTASGIPLGLISTPGQTATLNVTFAPSAVGSVTGSVAVTSNATNSPATISLAGTGAQVVQHSVTLMWTESVTTTVVGYNVYRATVSGGPYTKLNGTPIAGTGYTDSTVQPAKTYYYVATSINSNHMESAFSGQALVVIP